MSIPFSRDFKIKPSVIGAAGTALDMLGLLLTDNELATVGSVLEFSSVDEVSAYFGGESAEYSAAQIYFAGYSGSTVIPAKLLMSRFVTDAAGASGWLMSGSFKGINVTELQSINGTITVTIDGASETSTAIDMAGVSSFDDAATKIEIALDGKAVVTWLPVQNRFLIESVTKGDASQVSFATTDATATALKLTQDDGASISAGSAQSVVPDFMDNLKNLNQDWVLFTTLFVPEEADCLAFSAWVSASNYRFGYVPYDNTTKAVTKDSTDCLAYLIRQVYNYENVLVMYGDYSHAMTVLAYACSLDFSRTEGRVSYKFREFSGVIANVTDAITADTLSKNGYSFYGHYASNNIVKNYASDGQISGKFLWLDSFLGQVWINANLLGAFVNLFTENESFPFNAKGYSAIQAAVINVAQQAKNFGSIQIGVTLDNVQLQQINASLGNKDISSNLYNDGWYFYIPAQPSSSRIDRRLTGAILYYVDGQLIQSIDMSSIDVL